MSDHVLDRTVEVTGVIDMELLSVIRRWHHRDHIPIREIERRTGLSRNTIRKYLRSNAVEVRFKVPERPSRLDAFAAKVSDWLRVEAGKGRKQRRTARQIHADLVTLGYDGSYARVTAFVRQWHKGQQAVPRTTGRGVFVVAASPDGQVSLTDPDARAMTSSGRGTTVVGYNVQAAVDTTHHLIVAHEVTNATSDRAQLTPIGQQAQEATGRKAMTVLADRGYFSGRQIVACEKAGMMPYVPKPYTSGPRRKAGLASKTSSMCPAKTSTAAQPGSD